MERALSAGAHSWAAAEWARVARSLLSIVKAPQELTDAKETSEEMSKAGVRHAFAG
jgi:hypothetical protein